VRIEPAWVEEQRRLMPRPIEVFQSQLVESGIPPGDAKIIVANGGTPFLLAAYESYPTGVKEVAKYVVREVFGLANAKNTELAESELTPAMLMDVVKMVDEGKINREGARKVIEALFEQGGEAEEIARSKSLFQIRDGSVVAEALDAVLQERGDLLDQYRSGKTKVRDAIFGMVMKRLKGRGDPKEVGKALAQVLDEPE
jgi:aspartyl-tRNA(Asn)/glutamyl-tRNA(Gln) amidotransferase subunit B